MPRTTPTVLVLGTGSAGRRHIRTLAAAGAKPLAIPVRPGRVEELRREGIDVEESLERGLARRPDGAVIATDSGRHRRDAEACLEVCPVLVEKPLATNAADAGAVLDAGKKRGHEVHVACVLRFDAGLRWVHERRSRLGVLQDVDAECLSWLPSWRPGRDFKAGYAARPGEGGVLLDLVHELDYLAWMAGAPTAVQGSLQNRGLLGLPAEVEESASLSLEHPGGVRSTVRLSYVTRPASRRLRLWGERGQLMWDGIGRHATHHDEAGVLVEETRWTGPEEMYLLQSEAWLASLGGAATEILATGTDGARAVAVCDAARVSSSSGGRWEALT